MAHDAVKSRVVVKEGRPHAGLDPLGRDAVTRLQHEGEVLGQLDGLSGVPRHHGIEGVWEHVFLAMEDMAGEHLDAWILANMPIYRRDPASVARYLVSTHAVAQSLVDIVTSIHGRGWAHQDLHPRNILVTHGADGARVSLIDFEAARSVDDAASVQLIGSPGFRCHAELPPTQIDWFGVRQVITFLLLPVTGPAEVFQGHCHHVRRHAVREYQRLLVGESDGLGALALKHLVSLLEDLDAMLPSLVEPLPAHTSEKNHHEVQNVGDLVLLSAGDMMSAATVGLIATSERWRETGVDRAVPVHFAGLERPRGLAFGDAGVLLALTPEDDRREDSDAIRKLRSAIQDRMRIAVGNHSPGAPVGLFDGEVGDVLALTAAGCVTEVHDVLRERTSIWLQNSGPRVFDGLPGVLLGLNRLLRAPGLDNLHDVREQVSAAASRLANKYRRSPEIFAPMATRPGETMSNAPEDQDSGLLYGHLGLAWLFGDLYHSTGDHAWLASLNDALRNELRRYLPDVHGDLQLAQSNRLLPYLSTGSAGFGIVLANLVPSSLHPEVCGAVAGLRSATEPLFTVGVGLFNGYAGLILGNRGLARFKGVDPLPDDEVLGRLALHGLRLGDGLVFTGDGDVRITSDLATGAVGVIAALRAMDSGIIDLLPFGCSSVEDDLEIKPPLIGRR